MTVSAQFSKEFGKKHYAEPQAGAVQVLVFPAAVKVHDETEFAIKRLVSLRKHISRDEPAAYEEATTLLKRLNGYD